MLFRTVTCSMWLLFINFFLFLGRNKSWRISKNFEAERDHLISGKKFQIEYLDQSEDVEWEVPASCTAENSSAAVTSVTCRGANFYRISMVEAGGNETISEYIQMRESPLCYSWYIAPSHDSSNINSDTHASDHQEWVLRVWVVDPQHASPEEVSNNAHQPSESSKDVTMNMHKRGQKPTLLQKRKKRDQHIHIQSSNFNLELGYWSIEVNMQFLYEILLIVKGKPEVAVNGCIVRDTSAVLSLPKYTNIPSSSINAIRLTGNTDEPTPMLIQDPCTQSVILLIQSDSVILTQDSFQSFSRLYLPRKILTQNSNTSSVIQGAAFTPTHLLLLIDTTVFVMERDKGTFKVAIGLPPGGIDFLKGRHHCIPATVEQVNLSYAIAWGIGSQSFIIHFGDKDKTLAEFKQVQITQDLYKPLGFDQHSNVDIQDVAFDCPSGKVGFIVNVSQDVSSAVVVLIYNTVTEEWTNLPYWIEDDQNGEYSMVFVNTAESAFLFWSSHQIHYSYQDGLDVGTMQVQKCNTSVLGTSQEDTIQQVIVSNYGDIVVVMHPSNTLYYSRIGQYGLIELPASELPGVQQVIFFDSLGRLNSVTNDSASDGLSKWLYPLALHVVGNIYPDVCKYRHFEHNSTSDVYFLDLGDQLRLSAVLTYPLHSFNTLKVLSSSKALIKQQVLDSYEYYQGWQTLNRTIIVESSADLYGTEDYADRKDQAIADVVIEIKPENTDLSCKLPVAMTVHVSLGCPPGRHLHVRKPEECVMPTQYVIPRSALQNTAGSLPATNKAVNYSMDMGCPLSIHYKDTFLPAIDLYDGDVFIEEISANFVLQEINGRTDYSYTATMQQAGCESTAQTLHGMQERSANSTDEDQLLENIWGPQNYRHCFFENMTAIGEDLYQAYEILNRTRVNQIQWDTWKNDSIYQFRVQVIDPQYSFCHLQSSFGVRLIGLLPSDTPTTTIMRLSIGLFAFLTLSIGFVSYLIFRRHHIVVHELEFALINDEDEDVNIDGDTEPAVDIFNVARRRGKTDE